MAELFNQVLGFPSGKIGTLVFRRRKGGNIIALEPTPRSSPLQNKEVSLRSKFALAGKIASKINSLQVVKDVWPKNTGKGSKCNQMLKVNYDLINSAENLGSVTVGPLFGFNTINPVLTAGVTGVHLVTDALGVDIGIDTSVEKFIVSAGIIVLQTPTLENLPATQVMAFKSMQHSLDLINPVDHTVDFNGEPLALYQSYTVKKVFACFVTLDDLGKAIRYSSTVHS
jgi:hypothetical protein